MSDLINRQDAIKTAHMPTIEDAGYEVIRLDDILTLPSAQPEWGKPVGDGRPLADSEVIPRLQDIKAQIGGSYAIDRAIEVLEGLSSTQPEHIQNNAVHLCDSCQYTYVTCPSHGNELKSVTINSDPDEIKVTNCNYNDLISRQAAIDGKISIQRTNGVEMYSDEAVPVEYLKALPSAQPEQLERCPIYGGMCAYPSDQCYDCPRHHGAQPEQRWIPCSERLPEEDVEVLVTNDAGGMTTIEVDECGRYEDTGERFWYTAQNVTAWMPLPEPWKGADE